MTILLLLILAGCVNPAPADDEEEFPSQNLMDSTRAIMFPSPPR